MSSNLPTFLVAKRTVNINVPSGWCINISVLSLKSYLQIAHVRYDSDVHFFESGRGPVNKLMKDRVTGNETLTIAPNRNPALLELHFYYKTGSERKMRSEVLNIVPIPTPSQVPNESPNYLTLSIFVQDESSGQEDDMIATINLVRTVEPLNETAQATSISASQAVSDFQSSTGIPDEDLVPGPLYTPPPHLATLPVGILGAGAAGLYVALILDSLGIKYEILEGSGRHGGRLYTYQFTKRSGEYQYFDAGAMRFPDVIFMKRTFDLVRNKLKIGHKLIPVITTCDNTFLHFNGHRITKSDYQRLKGPGSTNPDPFRVGITANNRSGYVPEEYLQDGHKVLYDKALKPLRQYFVDLPFPEGLKKLMSHDMYSVRNYMSLALGYPNSVIQWIETMEWRTGAFDASLTETVLADMSFNDPRSESEGKVVEWYCFDGGSRVLADALLDAVDRKPFYNKRVVSVEEALGADNGQAIWVQTDNRGDPNTSSEPTSRRKYSNVISTLPLSVLRTVDLDGVYLSTGQKNGLRELLYSPSIKIGIQFSSAWWEKLGIVGGQSYTDRLARSIVYPSHGPGLGNSERSNVLIASYNGMQDSQRLGALMRGPNSAEEKILLNLIMKDLAIVHGVALDDIWKEYIDYYAWDWYSDSFTLGAFAWFGPGQFKDIYPHLTMPASNKQRFFFAGDATSAAHGWVVGALNSAWRCVRGMLVAHPELNPNPDKDIMKQFKDLWGASEEWDDKVLAKHVYLGRELHKRQQQSDH